MSVEDYGAVDPVVFEFYQASHVARNLLDEPRRLLKAEDVTWQSRNAKSLTSIALECVAANFEAFLHVFKSEHLPGACKRRLEELVPTSLPLNVATDVIPDGRYWERMCYDTWRQGQFLMELDDSWKRLYMEKYLQNYVEDLYPNVDVEDGQPKEEELAEVLEITAPYVRSLSIEQLLVCVISEDEEKMEMEVRRVNLELIISSLTHLKHLSIAVGVKSCNMDYIRSAFQFTLTDCVNIGNGLKNLKNLQKFRLHRTEVDAIRLNPILFSLSAQCSLTHLDLTSCSITDQCLKEIAAHLRKLNSLQALVLLNNNIGSLGAVELSSVIRDLRQLKVLNTRLNFIRDAGGNALFEVMATHESLERLNVAGCELSSAVAESLGRLIRVNTRLTEIILSANNLDDEGYKLIVEAVNVNDTLHRLDLRMNRVTTEDTSVSDKLLQNRKRVKGRRGLFQYAF